MTEIELQIVLKSNEISFNQILVKRNEIIAGYSFVLRDNKVLNT